MMTVYRYLVALHVFSNIVWIGSISAVGLLLARAEPMPLRERAKLALWPYRTLAVPAFLLSLTIGVACLILDPTQSILRIPSMHAKLTLAAGVIAIHHWIGAVARRRARGLGQETFPVVFLVILLVLAGGATLLGVVKPF